jgi:hypothetical protein
MFILDPKSFRPGSEIFQSRIRIKEYMYFYQKNFFLSSRNYSGLFIPDPDPEFLPIPDLGVEKASDPVSRIRIRNTDILRDPSATVQAMRSCFFYYYLPTAQT